jgi:hypothetical protein
MVGLSEYVPINFISICVLGALLLRRLVRMEGHHELRVVILTVLLWVPAVFLLLLPYAPGPGYDQHYCVPRDYERHVFCITE